MRQVVFKYVTSLALLLSAASCSSDESKLMGIWHTELEAIPQLKSAFDLELNHDFFGDKWSGRFEIAETMTEGNLSSVKVDGSKITLDLGQGAMFKGNLANNKQQITGVLNVPGIEKQTLRFTKIEKWSSQRPARSDKDNQPVKTWAYQAPPAIHDGWKVGTINTATGDSKPLRDLFENILKGHFNGLDAILVARNGKLLLEEYFYMGDRERIHSIQSCTKSVTSLLIGIAHDDGLIKNLDAPVNTFFPAYGDSTKRKMPPFTLRNALTMSAALDWREDIPYSDPRNDAVLMNQSKDMFQYVLSKNPDPKVRPGEVFEYNSGLSILLGGVIANTTGKPADQYATQTLFKDLGINKFTWTAMNGQIHTGGGLFMKPRDILKLGQLVLDEGKWNEKQIVSASWIKESTAFNLPVNKANKEWGYGYQWWRGVLRADNKVFKTIYAAGYGGQVLCIIPDLDLVILTLHHNATEGNGRRSILWKEMETNILPAFK
ncbi:beta-lactamase family protein [Dyadobacter sp. CY327]|uniref:serine hydrolase domain-containing protein n=1 Tax=Dyadobacter sp. CY327 TaxID=2907301 RepID=UPI001F31E27C|nr:serine hydrolase [Dyadobacter sp. CY327]MCE7073019.1 beta-lactamase family protein [Dyadobacter sp. CY327]